jgi:hypothetical protein
MDGVKESTMLSLSAGTTSVGTVTVADVNHLSLSDWQLIA